MKSKNRRGLLALVLCMVVALSNSSFIFASETVEGEYPQEAEVQTESEPAEDAAAVAYEEETSQPILDSQPVTEEIAEEASVDLESEEAAPAVEEHPTAETPAADMPTEEQTTENLENQEPASTQQMVWSAKVGTATVNVTADTGALPENAQLSVSEITSDKEVSEIEKAVEEKAIEEQFSIKNILSYDIKFLVEGSEVQPKTPVQVSVDTPEITSGEDAAVLHVNDKNVAEDMNGTVDGQGNVIFDAPHFSTYVIVQKGDSKVNVTIQHYDATATTADTKIYADDIRELPVGGKINDYTKATNWEVDHVVLVEENDGTTKETDVTDPSKISVTKDCTIKVYYTPKEETVDGATKFYDYTVKAGEVSGKWTTTSYSFNQLGDEAQNGQKLTAGEAKQNYSSYQYNFTVGGKSANTWTGRNGGVVTGLLKGLKNDGSVEFNYPEPGFFVDSDATVDVDGAERYLRKVYKDYKLTFKQQGDTYELKSVKDSSGTEVTTAGADFFPLDSVLPSYEDGYKYKTDSSMTGDGKKHNYYFGMRYDVTFKVGDYVGPLNYSFTGDDDLWVVLDGKQIVIDLGGIHDAASNTVNLWDYIGQPDTLTNEQKQKEHTLTVLYMERGAGASNCSMKFTLPSARISEVSEAPMADLVLQKVNSKGEKLQGARFTLTNNVTGEKQTAESVGTDGLAQFTKLRVGEYTLNENAAPSGYMPSLDSWIVKVTEENGTATATLYLSDGKTLYTDREGSYYQILNLTEEERIEGSMNYDKTATVDNWDERTYNINITASSKLTSTSTDLKESVADVMMVLDTSGSMLYNQNGSDAGGFVSVGQYRNVKDTLDTTKVYYYGNGTTNVTYSQWSYTNAKQPMIYMNGNWTYFNGQSWNSISKNETTTVYSLSSSLTGLKEAGMAFISSMAENSSQSRIGIATFNYSSKKEAGLLTLKGNKDTLTKSLSSVYASAGTSPQLGLNVASDELKANGRENVPRYVILFTDGAPSSDEDKTSSETQAELLRQEGIIVYTVGLNLTTSTQNWLSTKIASKGCAFEASNIDQLKQQFKKIEENISRDLDIKNAQIKDVIDPRFVILDDQGKQITSDYPGIANGITLSNGGTVYYDKDSGNQYIVWNEQTIPNSKNGSWSRTIKVQARENYIGGNNVPTNISPDSKISTGYGDAVLPQPKVNVKAELTVKDKEITIYKGDSLPDIDSVLEEMFDLTGNVKHYGVDKNDFHMTWYDENGTAIDETAISKDNDGTYHLKVTYDAGEPTAESTGNTAGNIAGGDTHTVEAVNEKDNSLTYGIYSIHIISGSIDVVKKLETPLTTDQTFMFEVKVKTSDNDETTWKIPVTVKAGEKEGTYDGEELSELARGTYTITEVVPEGFVLTEYQIDDDKTDCKNAVDHKKQSAVFKLGYEKNDKDEDVDVIKDYQYDAKDGGVLGTVSFTNEKATSSWDIIKVSISGNNVYLKDAEFVLKDAEGTVVYTGTSDATGKIEWKKDDQPVERLEKGTYILVETKAPMGYVLSTEKWTIKVTKGGSLVSVSTDKEDTEIDKSQVTQETDTLHLYFKNDVVYDLPSTGSTGIFTIMMSGILLMIAGVLIIFKMKGKEVLKQ